MMTRHSVKPTSVSDAGNAIHVGNVADFNEQFFARTFSPDHRASWRRESDHYACLAAFYSPTPAAVLLPLEPDPVWLEDISAALEWDKPIFETGLFGHPSLTDSIEARPGLVERLRAIGGPLLAWGACDSLGRLASLVRVGQECDPFTDLASSRVVQVVRHIESKALTNQLFVEIASDEVGTPKQIQTSSTAECASELLRAARLGHTSMLKAEYGVGGFGTRIVPPGDVTNLDSAYSVIESSIENDNIFMSKTLVIEEFIPSNGLNKDYTFDGFVLADGSVQTIDSASMIIEGTKYVGVTAGPGVVSDGLSQILDSFGQSVGGKLSRLGYRGWYDVDFVLSENGKPFATEINARRTGPTIAFSIRDRLNSIDCACDHAVRALDVILLPHHVSEDHLYDLICQLRSETGRFDVGLIPTLFTASTEADPIPYFGVALTCRVIDERTGSRLDQAEKLVRSTIAEQ
jgi:hypothetical protein